MIKGAKRQIVVCPVCRAPKVTLGDGLFRCCGENHKIREHLLTRDHLNLPRVKQGLQVQV